MLPGIRLEYGVFHTVPKKRQCNAPITLLDDRRRTELRLVRYGGDEQSVGGGAEGHMALGSAIPLPSPFFL